MKKQYDVFISYSSRNKQFVKRFAQELEKRRIRVWFDQWEMKPGDRLRDRIQDGMSNSRYFMVVLSEHSIHAPWVKTELDAAMMRELSENNVVVLPLLYGHIEMAAIPQDLKGKHYLDLRKSKNLPNVLAKLASFFQVDKKENKAYLKAIRDGLHDASDPIGELTLLAHLHHSEATVKAAITGLSKHKAPAALLRLGLCILDNASVGRIRHTIKVLGELETYGGLILLSSTLLYDQRFIMDKMETILKVLKHNNELSDVEQILRVHHYNIQKEPRFAEAWMSILGAVRNSDVREGAIFGSIYNGIWGWQWHFLKQWYFLNRYSSAQEINQAKQFVCSKIPQLDLLFEKRLGLHDYNNNSEVNMRVSERWKIFPF